MYAVTWWSAQVAGWIEDGLLNRRLLPLAGRARLASNARSPP